MARVIAREIEGIKIYLNDGAVVSYHNPLFLWALLFFIVLFSISALYCWFISGDSFACSISSISAFSIFICIFGYGFGPYPTWGYTITRDCDSNPISIPKTSDNEADQRAICQALDAMETVIREDLRKKKEEECNLKRIVQACEKK